jgi:hypothetical protein
MTHCPSCNLPRFFGPSGYVGPACQCSFSGYRPYRLWPSEPKPRPLVEDFLKPKEETAKDEARQVLAHIASLAHEGGLIGLSVNEALTAIRRLTLAHWDKSGGRAAIERVADAKQAAERASGEGKA